MHHVTQRRIHRHIHREHQAGGSRELLAWLETTDFFSAPASTKFHCACEGGLVQHSLSVYHTLMDRYFEEGIDNPESFAIAALLHDLCKANFYKVSTRNVKNEETGAWEKAPYYAVEDQFPYGHGEKSVYLIERFRGSNPRRPWPFAGTWAVLMTLSEAAVLP